MIYAVLADLSLYITADWLDELSSTVREDHLEHASALIDSYLGQRYKLPLTTGNIALTRACCILARWQLILHRGINTDSNYQTYEAEYQNIVRWLESVAKGMVALDGVVDSSTDSTATSPSKGFMVFAGRAKRWG